MADDIDRERRGNSSSEVVALDDRLYLSSAARALNVLETFKGAHRPKSLNDIAKDLDITKSAAQRTVYTLIAHGYLEKADGAGYRLGRCILDLTFDFLRMEPLVQRAAPVLTELRRNTNERVDLSLFDGTTMIYALRYQSKRETFYATLIGRRRATFTMAGGRACLAALPDREVDEILARSDLTAVTPRTIIDPEKLWEKIRQARHDTYAFASEEAFVGELAVGAAVTDHKACPIGAVHVAGLLSDWNEEEFRLKFAPLVIEAARSLSD
jgi:IclR family transcriptional regulator, pca regulon regulatory protein